MCPRFLYQFSQAPHENTMAQWHQTHMTYLPQLVEKIGRYHLKKIDGEELNHSHIGYHVADVRQ